MKEVEERKTLGREGTSEDRTNEDKIQETPEEKGTGGNSIHKRSQQEPGDQSEINGTVRGLEKRPPGSK